MTWSTYSVQAFHTDLRLLLPYARGFFKATGVLQRCCVCQRQADGVAANVSGFHEQPGTLFLAFCARCARKGRFAARIESDGFVRGLFEQGLEPSCVLPLPGETEPMADTADAMLHYAVGEHWRATGRKPFAMRALELDRFTNGQDPATTTIAVLDCQPGTQPGTGKYNRAFVDDKAPRFEGLFGSAALVKELLGDYTVVATKRGPTQ